MRIPALAACALLCGAAAFAQPTIDKIQNNYGWQLPGTPNYGIAQGSIFAIVGKNLGPGTATDYTSIVKASGYPLQTSLGGVTVSVAVGGTTKQVPLYYAWTGAISGVLPSDTPVGDGQLTVSYNGGAGTASIHVVARAFGMLSVNNSGAGTAAAHNFTVSNTAPPLSGFNLAAHAGDNLVLYGTGLGASTNDAALQNPIVHWENTIPVTVWFGATGVKPDYAGRSGYFPGFDQINVKVPAGLEGCNVSVYVQLGSGASASIGNFGTLPIASGTGRTCSDGANGVQAADVEMMTKGGRFGTIDLDHSDYDFPTLSMKTVDESVSASFYQIDPVSVGGIVAKNPFKYASVGSCSVWTLTPLNVDDIPDVGGKELDAGNALTIKGPASDTKTIARVEGSKGYYHLTLSPGSGPTPTTWLSPGAYTITGPGGTGADAVGGFTMNLTMPPTLVWTNRDSITNVTRSSGVTVTWTGADPKTDVLISGMSVGGKEGDPMVFFVCTAPASAKTFTVPPGVLLSLPPSGNEFLPGILVLGSYTNTKMTPPPTGLDILYGTTASTSGKTVSYQ